MVSDSDEIRSDYLFARPSVIEGVGRMIDLSNSYNTYNYSPTPAEADARAIQHDWEAVGHDASIAFEELRSEAQE